MEGLHGNGKGHKHGSTTLKREDTAGNQISKIFRAKRMVDGLNYLKRKYETAQCESAKLLHWHIAVSVLMVALTGALAFLCRWPNKLKKAEKQVVGFEDTMKKAQVICEPENGANSLVKRISSLQRKCKAAKPESEGLELAPIVQGDHMDKTDKTQTQNISDLLKKIIAKLEWIKNTNQEMKDRAVLISCQNDENEELKARVEQLDESQRQNRCPELQAAFCDGMEVENIHLQKAVADLASTRPQTFQIEVTAEKTCTPRNMSEELLIDTQQLETVGAACFGLGSEAARMKLPEGEPMAFASSEQDQRLLQERHDKAAELQRGIEELSGKASLLVTEQNQTIMRRVRQLDRKVSEMEVQQRFVSQKEQLVHELEEEIALFMKDANRLDSLKREHVALRKKAAEVHALDDEICILAETAKLLDARRTKSQQLKEKEEEEMQLIVLENQALRETRGELISAKAQNKVLRRRADELKLLRAGNIELESVLQSTAGALDLKMAASTADIQVGEQARCLLEGGGDET